MADIDLKPSVIATGAKTSSVPDTVAGLCDAFAHLLSPFVEVVVHDWEKQEVCYLSGNISDRNLGDHSFIDPIDMPLAPGQIFGPYSKTNPDGRPVKSVSYIPPDHQRMLICINFDVSKFQSILSALTLLIEVAAPEEANPFSDDWQERLFKFIINWKDKNGIVGAALKVSERRALLFALSDEGVFKRPKAAEAVAAALQVSRATIYSDLNSIKTTSEDADE